jgi:hypothetical protein
MAQVLVAFGVEIRLYAYLISVFRAAWFAGFAALALAGSYDRSGNHGE